MVTVLHQVEVRGAHWCAPEGTVALHGVVWAAGEKSFDGGVGEVVALAELLQGPSGGSETVGFVELVVGQALLACGQANLGERAADGLDMDVQGVGDLGLGAPRVAGSDDGIGQSGVVAPMRGGGQGVVLRLGVLAITPHRVAGANLCPGWDLAVQPRPV